MSHYGFYNAPLIETSDSEDRLSPGSVDDSMMLAIGDTLVQCHEKLKDMMEQPGGGFEWSLTHNSPFELSKMALMNFPRSYQDSIPGSLSLDNLNLNGSVTTSLTHPVILYKYLSVIFDPKLCWILQHTKALTTAAFWSSHIWCLSRRASGVSTAGTKQLYNTVAVPRFTYRAEVWYTYLHKPEGGNKTRGSVAITNKLCSMQQKIAKVITDSLSSTASDIMDIHAYVLPIELLFYFCSEHFSSYASSLRCTLSTTWFSQ